MRAERTQAVKRLKQLELLIGLHDWRDQLKHANSRARLRTVLLDVVAHIDKLNRLAVSNTIVTPTADN